MIWPAWRAGMTLMIRINLILPGVILPGVGVPGGILPSTQILPSSQYETIRRDVERSASLREGNKRVETT